VTRRAGWIAAGRRRDAETRLLTALLRILRASGIDDAESAWIGVRQFEIAIAHAVEELRGLDFETVDRAAPRLHALEPHLHRHVEQDRAIGIEIAVHGVRDLVDEPAIDSAAATLIGMRRIGESVAEHPLAASERRTDEVVDVHLARAKHEQRFSGGADVFLAPFQHEGTDSFRDLGAAGLAGGVHGNASRAQRLREAIGNRGFARALDAFKGYEFRGHHRRVPRRRAR